MNIIIEEIAQNTIIQIDEILTVVNIGISEMSIPGPIGATGPMPIMTSYDNHLINVSNPHSVTKSQVGLSNVDNTSDINKPISTAQATALSLKSNDNAVIHLNGNETITGQKTYNPTISAASAIARGMYLTPSLTATANNDVLVALDINSTFINGAFSGVTDTVLRLTPSTTFSIPLQINKSTGVMAFKATLNESSNYIDFEGYGQPIRFASSGIQILSALVSSTQATFSPYAAAGTPMTINGFAAQTANILNVNSSGNSGGNLLGIKSNGNVLINTLTDDTVNRLQVSGSIKFTQTLTSAATDLILSDSTGNIFRGVRAPAWSDNAGTRFLQIGNAADNIAFTTLNGNIANRMQFVSTKTQFTDASFGSTQIPIGVFEILKSNAVVFSVSTNGNTLLGTTTDAGYRLDVNGTTRLQNTLTLVASPTTSASTYDILTRNTSTGIIEKVSNTAIASIATGYLELITATDNTSQLTLKFPSGQTADRTGILFKGNDGTFNINYAEITGGVENWSADKGYIGFRTSNNNVLSEKARFTSLGNLLLGLTVDDGINRLQVAGSITATQHNISALNTAPASATATGTLGEIRVTATFIYVCISTNTWVRSALATW